MSPAKSSKLFSKPLTEHERRIKALYDKFLDAESEAAAQYLRADQLAFQLAQEIGAGNGDIHGLTVRISRKGLGLQVTDNYRAAILKAQEDLKSKKSTNPMPKVWAHAAGRQYSFEEVPALPAPK